MKIKPLQSSGIAHIFVLLIVVVSVGLIGTYLLVASHANGITTRTSSIVDVSWPQCKPRHRVFADTGIVGINNNQPFTHNPCLKQEAQDIKTPAFYVLSGYKNQHYQPSNAPCAKHTPACSAYNYGYKAGLYDIKYTNSKHLFSAEWWIDVEQPESMWLKNNVALNVKYLNGMMDALSANGVSTIGFYSNDSYATLTGSWQNNHPFWLATAIAPPEAHAAANHKCSGSPTGGPTWLIQYQTGGRDLDIDVACDGNAFEHNL